MLTVNMDTSVRSVVYLKYVTVFSITNNTHWIHIFICSPYHNWNFEISPCTELEIYLCKFINLRMTTAPTFDIWRTRKKTILDFEHVTYTTEKKFNCRVTIHTGGGSSAANLLKSGGRPRSGQPPRGRIFLSSFGTCEKPSQFQLDNDVAPGAVCHLPLVKQPFQKQTPWTSVRFTSVACIRRENT